MSLQDWKRFISLIPDETVILVDTGARFYRGGIYLDYFDCCLVFTNKRILCLSKKYRGLFSKKFVGYTKVAYEIFLDDINVVKKSNHMDTVLKIWKKNRLHSFNNFGIGLETHDKFNIFYKELSSRISI